MGDFLTQIQLVWPLVVQAPWGFLPVALALLFSGWLVGRFMYNERIATLKSRIEHRDELITNLRARANEAPAGEPDDFQRNVIIGYLTAEYINTVPDVSRRVKLGLEPPPAAWVNAELEKLGEDWRVRIDGQGRLVRFDLPRYG